MKIQKNMNQWNTIYFKDLEKSKGSFKKGPFGGALKKSMFVENGVKVYEQKHAIKKDNSIGSYYISKTDFANLKNFEVNPGDFIISCAGTIGEIYRLPENSSKGIINQALIKLTINENKINPDYLKHIFKYEGFKKQLIAQGGVIKNLNLSTLKLVKINCPNIDQQERIAHILSTQEEQIERIKGLIKKLKKRNQYYAEKLLSGELRIRENKEAGKTELYENEEWQEVVLNGRNCKIPNGWNILKVQDIVKMSMGNTILNKDILKIDDFSGNLIPVFSATETLKVFGFIDKSKAKKTLNANDFIISARGTIGSVHRMKELSTSTQTTIQCVKIKEDNNILYYYLKNNRDNLLKGNGGAIPQLTIKMLNNIETVYPENEGLIISQFIEAINKELENVKKLLPKEEKRFQWMLDNLLSGEYEVVEN